MSGQLREERTSLDRKYRLQRCSLRQVLQVQYTDLWQQVPWQLLILHPRVFFWWSRTFTKSLVSSFRALSMYPLVHLLLMHFPFSETIPTLWPVVRPDVQCSANHLYRKLWTWHQLLIWQQSKVKFRSSTSSMDSVHLTRSRRSRHGTMKIWRIWQIWMLSRHSVTMHLIRIIHVREVQLRTLISSSRQEKHVTRSMMLFRQ